jgi:transposase
VALGYKQLVDVEDAFRTLKTTLELRPMYHRIEDRIRAHILISWLALLLVRIAEVKTTGSNLYSSRN